MDIHSPVPSDWAAHKDEIIRLFRVERRSLAAIREMLLTEHHLNVDVRQLEYRLKIWGVRKNIKKAEYKSIRRALQERTPDRDGVSGSSRPTTVLLEGMQVPSQKLIRNVYRKRERKPTPEDGSEIELIPNLDVIIHSPPTNYLSTASDIQAGMSASPYGLSHRQIRRPSIASSNSSSSYAGALDTADAGSRDRTRQPISLACPYAKYKPEKYTSCLSYHAPALSRVKEHLKRKHQQHIPRDFKSWASIFSFLFPSWNKPIPSQSFDIAEAYGVKLQSPERNVFREPSVTSNLSAIQQLRSPTTEIVNRKVSEWCQSIPSYGISSSQQRKEEWRSVLDNIDILHILTRDIANKDSDISEHSASSDVDTSSRRNHLLMYKESRPVSEKSINIDFYNEDSRLLNNYTPDQNSGFVSSPVIAARGSIFSEESFERTSADDVMDDMDDDVDYSKTYAVIIKSFPSPPNLETNFGELFCFDSFDEFNYRFEYWMKKHFSDPPFNWVEWHFEEPSRKVRLSTLMEVSQALEIGFLRSQQKEATLFLVPKEDSAQSNF